MVYRGLTVWFFLSFVFVAGGCRRGDTFIPVKGTITKAGQPLAGVQITFYPDLKSDTGGPISRGLTDTDGHYCLKADSGDDGAVVGEYRVCIVEPVSISDLRIAAAQRRKGRTGSSQLPKILSSKMDQEPTERKVPAKYADAGNTPLRAEVRPGSNQTIDFNIP